MQPLRPLPLWSTSSVHSSTHVWFSRPAWPQICWKEPRHGCCCCGGSSSTDLWTLLVQSYLFPWLHILGRCCCPCCTLWDHVTDQTRFSQTLIERGRSRVLVLLLISAGPESFCGLTSHQPVCIVISGSPFSWWCWCHDTHQWLALTRSVLRLRQHHQRSVTTCNAACSCYFCFWERVCSAVWKLPTLSPHRATVSEIETTFLTQFHVLRAPPRAFLF